MFGSNSAPNVSYASVVVAIPPDSARKIGDVQWPQNPPGNPQTDFVTISADYLDGQSFNNALSAQAKQAKQDKVLVFVHGFNTRFDEAVYRFAQIVHDSGVPSIPVVFSWPSVGEARLIAYTYDREVASNSSSALEQLVNQLTQNPNVKEITILAHSMGSIVTLGALRSMAMRSGEVNGKIKNVLLVAPDVSVGEFRANIQRLGSVRPRFALFVSQDDSALKLSRLISGGMQRLGDINPNQEPYRSELARMGVLVFDLTHLQGEAHSRAFASVTTVMGMIEQRLAAGQQLTETSDSARDAGQ